MRYKVEEDEDARSCTESHMNAAFFNAQAFAHGSLYVEDIELLLLEREVAISTDQILRIDVLQDKVT